MDSKENLGKGVAKNPIQGKNMCKFIRPHPFITYTAHTYLDTNLLNPY